MASMEAETKLPKVETQKMTYVIQKRLQKELQAMTRDPPPGVQVDQESCSRSLSEWVVDLEGAQGTLYEGEKFQLQFKFGSKYPFDSPQVVFLGPNIPVHPHVYSNGHICLSILTEDWSPALSVQSVCLSIVSMLSSCTEKMIRGSVSSGLEIRAATDGAALTLAGNGLQTTQYMLKHVVTTPKRHDGGIMMTVYDGRESTVKNS